MNLTQNWVYDAYVNARSPGLERALMYRLTVSTMLITLSMLLWLSAHAMAFTLRLGPVADADATVPGSESSDLPTPQLFRIKVGQDGVTLGTTHPSEGFGSPKPEIGIREVAVPQPTLKPEARQNSHPPTTYRLSGVELLLLRDTQVVVDRQAE